MGGKKISKVLYTLKEKVITMIVADFRIIPVGEGTSLGDYVKAVYKLLDDKGISYLPGPMSTSVETETLKDLLDMINSVNQMLAESGLQRIMTTLNIDYRLDKEASMESKLGDVGEQDLREHIRCKGI
jgi:uncharacterized protein (TIGR00106 family)